MSYKNDRWDSKIWREMEEKKIARNIKTFFLLVAIATIVFIVVLIKFA